ncbi:sensor histidine kinase [Pseudosporangium ferrugineum]|uniref:sensor histidine kinase n=1 Tax=Pseudosporangium ferrugineum TaxID=439699 RepID=UPI001B8083CA|nr:HAMP domain-containing sensor histidine kinase [Pseudosporangium ferrugineum]
MRLLAACALVAFAAAGAAAWAGAESAGDALLASHGQQLTRTVTDQVGAVTPSLSYPPDQATLDRLRAAVGGDTLVTYRGLRSAAGTGPGLVTPELRDAVRDGNRLVTQRVVAGGTPWLLIGTPVVITAVDGTRRPSGIEVYTARDLTGVDGRIDDLTRSAIGAAALSLPLAALLALLAARSVLRPVRELRDTAGRLAAGDLGARTAPVGADELADLTVTINEMAGSVQASMAAMRRMQADARRFAADASHELRTPLSTLTAVMEVLADTADDMEPDARESARLAIAETRRLVRLAEDLMEVSRFDAGTAALRVEEIDLAVAVRESLRARGWLDRVEVEAPGPLPVRADRRRLDVVVANLAGNALRHGGPPVRVRLGATPGEVWAEVTDGGPGLAASALPHVFERFWKAGSSRTGPGNGLGLAIALENVRLHGGRLTAGNADGGGARFLLHLPRDAQETR